MITETDLHGSPHQSGSPKMVAQGEPYTKYERCGTTSKIGQCLQELGGADAGEESARGVDGTLCRIEPRIDPFPT